MNQLLRQFWSVSPNELLLQLQTTEQGLREDEAQERLTHYGSNLLRPKKKTDVLTLLLSQFKSPIILILLFAAVLSLFVHDSMDALIILVIVLVSGLLGFWQERGAANATAKLFAMVQIKATVIRDGQRREIAVQEIVPGDIIVLSAGDVLPGDCLILQSKDLFVDEATLTGETYPVEKSVGIHSPETPLGQRSNSLFMGTHVVSGQAKAVIAHTGKETEFGKVSERLKLRPPETEFEHGIRRFGYFIMELTLVLVMAIFAINIFFKRPVLESFLFALALAVGLTPQLLPAIISVNLAHGAKGMALKKVIVKRLASIENFGSMNVLCSDKTGTVTEGQVRFHSALDVEGKESEKVFLYAYLNAFYETGFTNPVDQALRAHRQQDITSYQKQDEIPYDFIRKRLTILVAEGETHLMITKGALLNVLEVCRFAECSDGTLVDVSERRDTILKRFDELSRNGFRTLGIAYKDIPAEITLDKEYERDMTFLGFLVFFDPPKAGIVQTLGELNHLGVSLKLITGDNQITASYVGRQVGLSCPTLLTGKDLHEMSDEALFQRVSDVEIFAEIEPNQKERIILALKKGGNVVGYIGDGINDASALHAADVGISVDSAVDVAKEAADIVLLEKDLGVLVEGVREGRRTFANTLKYVFMATSANFGNMFSMAGASLFLPFLPMLPKQILLTNLLTDFPEMTIATDSVDREMVEKPRRWNIKFIRNFMIIFGPVSSVFDFLTFGVLLFILHAEADLFRTGWFLESVISASAVVLVVRTRGPFFKSRPGRYLLITTLLIIGVTFLIPYSPLGNLLGFQPLSGLFILLMGMIVGAYVIVVEVVKRSFYRKINS